MKALCWYGKEDVRVETVPDPEIEDDGDVIIQVTATAICGSDLHLYGAKVPTLERGDILGHEFMGVVVETGSGVTRLKKGDRVVVPFTIACGRCHFCERDLYSLCDTTNPNEAMAREQMGHATAGMFGYGHITGGFSGGQAELVRVPHADVGPLKVPEGLPDDKVLFLSDIFPTGWMAAENAGVSDGGTVAVWGCGPVGLFAIQSAWMLGAGRVIAIDHEPERLALARTWGKAEVIDSFDADKVYETLMEMTEGFGPAACIDAVGMEAHGSGLVDATVDAVKGLTRADKMLNRPHVLQQLIKCCKKGGTLSIPGVYVGYLDAVPFGAAMNKGLTWKMGQTHMQHYMKPLLERVQGGEIDLSTIITHRLPLDRAPEGYATFQAKKDGCIKVVLSP
ncbi:MAG: glutathione-dependent formaldehyde dehydrogenase [Deltaproteobacteria bacterium]|nr:glutathione-dependent formaldehyde dehydrogenase [Deltaproteobacteria bacterium]